MVSFLDDNIIIDLNRLCPDLENGNSSVRDFCWLIFIKWCNATVISFTSILKNILLYNWILLFFFSCKNILLAQAILCKLNYKFLLIYA